MLESVSKRRQVKTNFSVSSVKKLLLSKICLWTNCWDEQYILLSSSKTEQKSTRAQKRSLMKILSAWWNFRSSKRWKLFLSVDRLKPTFWSHPWKNCLLLKNSNGWITEMNGVYCPLTVKRSRSAPAPQKEVWWRFWVYGETSEAVNVGICF